MKPGLPPADDAFTAHLAALDDALAAGAELSSVSRSHVNDPALKARLAKGLACVAALQSLRPGQIRPDLHGKAIDDTSHLLREAFSPTPEVVPAPEAMETLKPGMKLGRYELLRELGRGGFGVMFLASDPQLRRQVALKVPHASALFSPELRARFRQEARAVAALVHPNIVTVHEAGDIGPISYIAYAFCPGVNLADWRKRHPDPVPPGQAAELVAVLAEAIAHAHQRNVWHRDLKPANVMLTWRAALPLSDEQAGPAHLSACTPMVIDFGLARIDSPESGPTRTGAIIGTPAYMAPEQARGLAAEGGAAVDVHALGVLLYELLTGRPPFRGESDIDTLLQVQFRDPIAPRTLRPGLPRDLETICLRCLEKEPRRRYPSAAALAADLRRFCGGEAIWARPVSPVERAWRWCRKHPVVASLSLALLIAVAAGITGVLWQAGVARAERNTARAEQRRTARQYERSHEVIRRLTALSEELLQDPATELKGRDLVRNALEQYQRLLAEEVQNPTVQRELALLTRRLAGIQNVEGDFQEANNSYAASVAAFEKLLTDEPRNTELIVEAARTWIRYGHLLRVRMGDPAGSRRAYERAIALSKQGRQITPSDINFDLLEAVSWLNLATLVKADKKLDEALALTERAIQMQRAVLERVPDSRFARNDLALSLDYQGQLLYEAKQPVAARLAFEEALELRSEGIDDPKVTNDVLYDYGTAHFHLAVFLSQSPANDARTEAHFRYAAAIYSRLLQRSPNVPANYSHVATMWNRLGRLFTRQGRVSDAYAAFVESIRVNSQAVRAFPNYPHIRVQVAINRVLLAENLLSTGDPVEAGQQLDQAIVELENVDATNQDYLRFRPRLLRVAAELAGWYEQFGDAPAALEARLRCGRAQMILP